VRAMLTLGDREEISRGLAEGLEYKQIAFLIGRNPSVVSREVARHGGRVGYRAATADTGAAVARRRPKTWAVQRAPGLREVVRERLRLGWSPASIAGRLAFDYPDEQAYRVSHEAIYQWVYAQPVSTLARELIGLRTGRTARRGGARSLRRGSVSPATWTNAPPRSRAGRSPGTGKVTWSSARQVRAPWRRWSSAPPGSWSWSR
jgi:transposase, IS30 family